MAKVIIASVIISSVTIMTSVTYGKCDLAGVTYGKCYIWQMYYGKNIYGKNIMANETEPINSVFSKLSIK